MGLFGRDTDMGKETITQGTEHNTLAYGTVAKGEIQAENDFRIDGSVEGSIVCKGKVVVGSKGYVEGSLTCANAEISGSMKGKLYISEKLSLRSSATIEGEIYTKVLSVEEGAKIIGTCDMSEKRQSAAPSTGTAESAKAE